MVDNSLSSEMSSSSFNKLLRFSPLLHVLLLLSRLAGSRCLCFSDTQDCLPDNKTLQAGMGSYGKRNRFKF